jgi:hypothetical protein
MRRLLHSLAFALLMPLLASCGPSDERAFKGYLYFVQSPYLMRFGLRDDSLVMVTHLGNRTIREISPFGEGRLLISETASVNRRNVARISWLDLKTGQSEALYSGVQARFVERAGAIVYDDGGKLYAVSLAGDAGLDTVVLSHRRNQLSGMVEVADGELLFETVEDDRPVVYAYRAATGELRTLEALAQACRLEGAVWIDDMERLACQERSSGGEADPAYVFADLDGTVTGRPALPGEGVLLALAYIREQGVIVFRESRPGVFGGQRAYGAWAHDVRTGENHLLSDTHNLGTSVVYTAY